MAAGSSAPELFTSIIEVLQLSLLNLPFLFLRSVHHKGGCRGRNDCGLCSIQHSLHYWSVWAFLRTGCAIDVVVIDQRFHLLHLIGDGAHFANFCRNSSVLMVDELLSAYPHQLSFSEASLRIMITSHFGPKTRLSMASRMLINERQRLISKTVSNGEPEVSIKMPSKHNIENGTGPSNSTERSINGQRREEDRTEARNERENENENEDNQNNENDEEEEEEEEGEGPYVPFHLPVGMWDVVKWAIAWPLCFLMYFTIPNCAKPRWEKYFMFTFVSATLWIAVFSYMMVWMVTIIGYTLGIPDVIMGITFLAAGTSVPDCMASLIVARQGMGDMAVSNSIGSNVFDILMGLGLPWTIKTIVVNYGSYLALNSRGLVYSVGLLLASVFVTVIGVHLNKWKLDKKLGCVSLFLYAVFLCFSIMTEFNVFTFVNLPMCREH
ncbi:hypothetical protein chiPu_0004240 [Chiloscyllium punctatum]|uniref:Sodium/calcium exchanger membrane region domain-containing protein n=1 Tax=Chiloscyllium punctatum TaxID=137246 RepID=A0A401S618_CHIPU|nr:hypothetical protein [Chiloscyllium punctatum]